MEDRCSSLGQKDPLDLPALMDYFFVEIVPLAASSAPLSRETIAHLVDWAQAVQAMAGHPRIAPALTLAHPPYPFPPHRAVYSLGLVFLENVRLSSRQCFWVETRLRAALGTSSHVDRIAFRAALQQRKSAKRAILRAAYVHPQTRIKTQAQDLLHGRADHEVELGVEPSADPLYTLMLRDRLPRLLDALGTRSTNELNRAFAANATLLTECINYFQNQPQQQAHPVFPKIVISSDLFRRRFRSAS